MAKQKQEFVIVSDIRTGLTYRIPVKKQLEFDQYLRGPVNDVELKKWEKYIVK